MFVEMPLGAGMISHDSIVDIIEFYPGVYVLPALIQEDDIVIFSEIARLIRPGTGELQTFELFGVNGRRLAPHGLDAQPGGGQNNCQKAKKFASRYHLATRLLRVRNGPAFYSPAQRI